MIEMPFCLHPWVAVADASEQRRRAFALLHAPFPNIAMVLFTFPWKEDKVLGRSMSIRPIQIPSSFTSCHVLHRYSFVLSIGRDIVRAGPPEPEPPAGGPLPLRGPAFPGRGSPGLGHGPGQQSTGQP